MRTIDAELTLSIGYRGATQEEIVSFDVEDEATQKEIAAIIEAYYQEWITGFIDGGWRILPDEEK